MENATPGTNIPAPMKDVSMGGNPSMSTDFVNSLGSIAGDTKSDPPKQRSVPDSEDRV